MLYKQIQKISKISIFAILGMSLFIGFFAYIAPQTAYADTTVTCNDGTVVNVPTGGGSPDDRAAATCPDPHRGVATGATTTSDTSISEPTPKTNDCKDSPLNRDNCGIVRYIALFINILSALVGIVVTAVIIWGGIEYSTAGGDPSKIQSAKKRIYNGITSLVAFIFTYAFLQYIVPGGLF